LYVYVLTRKKHDIKKHKNIKKINNVKIFFKNIYKIKNMKKFFLI